MKEAKRFICTCMLGTTLAVGTCAWADADKKVLDQDASAGTAGDTANNVKQLREIVVEERSDSMLGIADT